MRKAFIPVFLGVLISSVACAGGPGGPHEMMPPPAGFDVPADIGGFAEINKPLWLKYARYPECTQFLDETAELRRQYHIKKFEYFEAARKAETSGKAMLIDQEIRSLFLRIDSRAPMRCRGGW